MATYPQDLSPVWENKDLSIFPQVQSINQTNYCLGSTSSLVGKSSNSGKWQIFLVGLNRKKSLDIR